MFMQLFVLTVYKARRIVYSLRLRPLPLLKNYVACSTTYTLQDKTQNVEEERRKETREKGSRMNHRGRCSYNVMFKEHQSLWYYEL